MTFTIGRLQALSVRELWADEARHFTPWLAEAENLQLLGEALGLALELEAMERSVGPFSADILARDQERDAWVVIENQLEATDHRHLGQLLTYAAGLSAKIIVWIAPDFREEHRAAIDWLNQATSEGYDFFGVQVEAVTMGGQIAAPRFNVVAKPNSWQKKAAAGKRELQKEPLSAPQQRWTEYWTGVLTRLAPLGIANRSPGRSNWQSLARLRRVQGLTFDLVAVAGRSGLRIEIYIAQALAKAAFAQLELDRSLIEQLFGGPLSWEPLPSAIASRVAAYAPGNPAANFTAPSSQYDWLFETIPRLLSAVEPSISQLDVAALARAENDAAG